MDTYTCPICGCNYTSPRAMIACEERCEREDRDARRILH